MLEAGSNTKFQLLPLFNIVGPFLGLTRNLGRVNVGLGLGSPKNYVLGFQYFMLCHPIVISKIDNFITNVSNLVLDIYLSKAHNCKNNYQMYNIKKPTNSPI